MNNCETLQLGYLCSFAVMHVYLCYEQLIHDSEAEVEVLRLKVDKAREKVAQLKLAVREKRGQAKGCSLDALASPAIGHWGTCPPRLPASYFGDHRL